MERIRKKEVWRRKWVSQLIKEFSIVQAIWIGRKYLKGNAFGRDDLH